MKFDRFCFGFFLGGKGVSLGRDHGEGGGLESKGRISHLDGLRGLAILSVVLFHAYSRWSHIEPWVVNEFVRDLFSNLWLGVELFFIISGFVIYLTLDKCHGFFQFAMKRWLRLFPAMLLCSVFIYVTAFLIEGRPLGIPKARDFLPGLTFVDPIFWESLLGVEFRSLDGAFWSLYVEVRFYLVAAGAYYLLRDRQGFVVLFFYVTYLLFFALNLFFGDVFPVVLAMKVLGFFGAEYYGWFLVGIFYYRYWKSSSISSALLSMFFGGLAVFSTSVGKGFSVFALSIFILMIFWVSFFSARISRLLSRGFIMWLGFISYPLYLLHQNFVTGLAMEVFERNNGLWGWFYPVLPLLVVVFVSYMVAKSEPILRGVFSNRLEYFTVRGRG